MPATYASRTCGNHIVCLALLCASMLAACKDEVPARDVEKTMAQQEAAASRVARQHGERVQTHAAVRVHGGNRGVAHFCHARAAGSRAARAGCEFAS